MQQTWVRAAFVAVLLAAVGCVKEHEVELKVVPARVDVGPGGSFTFDVVQSGTFDADATWSIVEGSWTGSIDENGVFVASDALVPGDQVTIRATSTLYPQVYGEAVVTVVLLVDPPAGPSGGGNLVRVQAADSDRVTRVAFGGVDGTELREAGPEAILVRAPAGTLGPVDVEVEYDDGTLLTHTRAYRYRLSFLRLGGSAALPAPDGVVSTVVGDFDGDGELEVGGGANSGAVGVVDKPATGPELYVKAALPGPIEILRAGDVDSDGLDELIAGWYDPDLYNPVGDPVAPGAVGVVFFKDGELSAVADRVTIPDWDDMIAVEVGDTNGDGQTDLVYLQYQADFDLNTGALVVAHSVQEPVIEPALAVTPNIDVALPSSLAVADLDGDNVDEIIVGHAGLFGFTGHPMLEVLKWDGSNYVQIDTVADPNPTQFNAAMRLMVGHFDGDATLDVLTFPLNYAFISDGRLSFLVRGTGTSPDVLGVAEPEPQLLSEPTGYLGPAAISNGFDNCACAIAGCGGYNPNSVYVCEDGTAPAYEPLAFIAGLFATSSRAADLNDDGFDDIPMLIDLSGLGGVGDEGVMAVLNQTDGTYDLPDYTLLGGWFAPETTFPAFSPARSVTADLDGDSKPELIYPRWSYKPELGRFQILDTRAFEAAPPGRAQLPRPARAVAIGDFDSALSNGNGPDLAALVSSDMTLDGDALELHVALADANGEWPASTVITLSERAFDIVTADVTGDGSLDLVLATEAGIRTLANDGNGAFGAPSAPLSPTGGATRVKVADLDFDNTPDYVAIGLDNDVYVMESSANFVPERVPVGGAPEDLAIADVDGDGALDVVVAGGGATSVAVLRYDGKDALFAVEEIDLSISPRRVAAADLDADGKAEVILSDEPDVVTVLSLAPVQGIEGANTIYTGLDDPENCPLFFPFPTQKTTSLAVADMDLDGLADLVVGYGSPDCLWVQSDVAVLPGVRGGSFASPLQYFAVDLPVQVQAGDFDGDGKTDLGALIVRNASGIYAGVPTESGVVFLENTSQ